MEILREHLAEVGGGELTVPTRRGGLIATTEHMSISTNMHANMFKIQHRLTCMLKDACTETGWANVWSVLSGEQLT